MACKICGDERSEYRDRSRMSLCDSCHEDTPTKVGREEFERVYWAGDDCPRSIRNEFWDDYKASQYATAEEYRDATTSAL